MGNELKKHVFSLRLLILKEAQINTNAKGSEHRKSRKVFLRSPRNLHVGVLPQWKSLLMLLF